MPLQKIPHLNEDKFTWDSLHLLVNHINSVREYYEIPHTITIGELEEQFAYPNLNPSDNCSLFTVSGNIVGYKLVRPELQIGRTVLDFSLDPTYLNVMAANEVIRSGISTARLLGAKFLHICLPSSEFWPDLLFELGFSKVREYWGMRRKPSPIKPPSMLDNFVISGFEIGDEQTLTRIQNAAFDGSWGFCPNTVEEIRYRLSTGPESNIGVRFLKDGSHTAGYCWPYIKGGDGPTTGIIGMIGISPEYRKQGLSEPLLLSSLAYLSSEGAETIELEVDSTNAPAIRLYSSQGFMKISTSYWFELFL